MQNVHTNLLYIETYVLFQARYKAHETEFFAKILEKKTGNILPPNFFPAICHDQKQRDKRPRILSVLLLFLKEHCREMSDRFVFFSLLSRFGGLYLRFRLEEGGLSKEISGIILTCMERSSLASQTRSLFKKFTS